MHGHLGRVLWVSVLAGIVATFLGNYAFGQNAFLEIQPMIRALMDPNYLPGDLVAQGAREFGPRFYFNEVFAWIANPETLPYFFFVATLIVNVATALVAALFTRDVFKSNLAAVIVVVLVMSLTTFQLGASPRMFASQINSARLAWPLAVGGVWAAYKRRPLLCGLLTGVAALSHPTLGAETGGLALGALALVILIERPGLSTALRRLAPVAGGLVVLCLLLVPMVIPYAQMEKMAFDDFRQIRLMRNAHELLPSHFTVSEWITACLFLTGAGLAWRWTREKGRPSNPGARYLLTFTGILVVVLLIGFLFVEVVPIRVFFVLDVFHRLTPFLAWIGLMVLAGEVAMRFESGSQADAYYSYVATVNPLSTGLSRVLVIAGEKTALKHLRSVPGGWWALAYGLVVAAVATSTHPRTLILFILISGVAGWTVFAPERWGPVLVPTVGVGVLVISIIGVQTLGGLPRIIDEAGAEILPSQMEGEEVNLAMMLDSSTPRDALLVAPPDLGSIRVFGERSLLVGFKAIPYQEDRMLEWRNRLYAAYGRPSGLGPDAQAEMIDSYRDIPDERLLSLCDTYGVTDAVLFADTSTALPVIGSTDTYKLVELPNCS
jgi:hypothetical protein